MLAKLILSVFAFGALLPRAMGLGESNYVSEIPIRGSFPLFHRSPAPLLVDTNDWPGVIRAANDLRTDINSVTGRNPDLLSGSGIARDVVIIGTTGKSQLIEQLARSRKIDVSPIAGKWESFFLQVVPQPLPGVDKALVICGSDKRGTIYGIYDLCEQIGVSPWHFWADVPPKRHSAIFIAPGKFMHGPPSVKYRGIFLNDEAPALTGWVKWKYGLVPGLHDVANYGRGFYTKIFELLLRLRGNYLWPAMWNNAFNQDDPENARLADEYGIVMGTSHQEPMLRAQKEWDRGLGRRYGNWNYNLTNQQPVLQQFWREGIRRNKNYESIVTLGLRAENDSGLPIGKELTEEIVKVQRRILAEEMNPDLAKVPQMWCLYKEVQDFYRLGLRVPDDVTLLWSDDNWGNIRRLPTAEERKRGGGAGIYYHFDYHGGPRSYQWLNTSPITKVWDQLSLAKQYGADRIWIVNVGHFKGYEFPMEFFLRFAWDTGQWTNENLDEYTRLWAQREFGSKHADEIAQIITGYTKFNGRRKPELLDASTYSLVNYGECEKIVSDYQALATRAERISKELAPDLRDAFYELVLFPTRACAQVNALYLAAARNDLYTRQGRANAARFAEQTRELFMAQTNLMDDFNHRFAGGKWNHFMDQTHLGYTGWRDPAQDSLDAIKLTEPTVPDIAEIGVAIEGAENALTENHGILPAFDSFARQERFIDVFNKGSKPAQFSVKASAPWIIVNRAHGSEHARPSGALAKDERFLVHIDWPKAPPGSNSAEVRISAALASKAIKVNAFNPAEPTRDSLRGFIESDGCISIEAEHYAKNAQAGPNRWIRIPNYGHTLSGMRADGPVDVLATPGKDSPSLEYKMYLFHAGTVTVEAFIGATLNFLPGRALRYAASFDDGTPQVITAVPADYNAQNGNMDWEATVERNGRHVVSTHSISAPGYHTLKIWMIDPGVVLEKVVVNTGGVRPSYLGPPESFNRDLR